jgi:hypothetical protein
MKEFLTYVQVEFRIQLSEKKLSKSECLIISLQQTKSALQQIATKKKKEAIIVITKLLT